MVSVHVERPTDDDGQVHGRSLAHCGADRRVQEGDNDTVRHTHDHSIITIGSVSDWTSA